MANQTTDPTLIVEDNVSTGITTQPAPPTSDPTIKLGFFGWLRWAWRQLTSMRTALFLLFLLALASIPGSLLPQRGNDPIKVAQYLQQHPGWGGFFDRVGFFDVFAAPWFGAIYILLCVSLAGCVLPRSRVHFNAMRSKPPAAPSRPSRLPDSHSWLTEREDRDFRARANQELLDQTQAQFKSRRWRTSTSAFDGNSGWVSAEKGYLRETGNLLFHLSLLAMLFGVASGAMFGWKGQVIVVEGQSFSNTATQYDSLNPGRFVNKAKLPPFSFTLDKFSASYQQGGEQMGAPREFAADVTYRASADSPIETKTVAVNSPLSVDGAKGYLVGHGYAPVIKVTDKTGAVVYDAPTVFLPQDGNFTSGGVVKLPDAATQLGIQGIFVPTMNPDPSKGPRSIFPAADNPALFMSAWRGNLGLDDGVPQSVYELDTSKMEQLSIKALRPGETWKLPEGEGTVTFEGIKQYATLDIAHDPGKMPALIAAALAILGLMLSLFVPRRRIFVRVSEAGDDRSRIEVAGLSRTDEVGLVPAVDDVAERVSRMAPPAQSNPLGTLTTDPEGSGSDQPGPREERS